MRQLLNLPWDACVHSARHTALTNLDLTGVDPFTLQRAAGHVNISTTRKYVHPTPRAMADAFQKKVQSEQRDPKAARRKQSRGRQRQPAVSPAPTLDSSVVGMVELAYGIFCWRVYQGSRGLLAVIVIGNLANLSFLSPAIPGPESYLAGRPLLLVTVVFVQIVVTMNAANGAVSYEPKPSFGEGSPGHSTTSWPCVRRSRIRWEMIPTDSCLPIAVAVGTVIADRPPHRSVRARLRIRLLRRMGGVEASIGVGMQDAGWWYPPSQEWSNALPSHLCALAAADQNIPPQSVDTTFEDAQLINVARHSMVLVVT